MRWSAGVALLILVCYCAEIVKALPVVIVPLLRSVADSVGGARRNDDVIISNRIFCSRI